MNFQSATNMSHDLFYATNFNILTDIDLTPNTSKGPVVTLLVQKANFICLSRLLYHYDEKLFV